MSASYRAMADSIAQNYAGLGQPREQLLVEQEIFKRCSLEDLDGLEWGNRVLKTLRQTDEALTLKAAVWDTMTVDTPSYFGWACELANEYRQNYRREEALRVVQQRHTHTQQALTRRPRDTPTRYHARQATLALIGEYEFGNRLSEAAAVREHFAEVA
ncbi:hypothetical protein FKW77_003896 [Venturia effusa]|uniref:Uncharacterized protein n=1 Tax=Venturia effusa TaxID=50376 RepID=A0A517L593_9PEZI|nr:hypothetical protein FKW77_003896 [Venturia effusa]